MKKNIMEASDVRCVPTYTRGSSIDSSLFRGYFLTDHRPSFSCETTRVKHRD